MAKKKRFTAKQKLFADYYMQCWNGTQAAELAGYAGSRSVLAGIAYENLRKPHIQEYIEERLSEAAMGANEVLARLAAMARGFDPADYMEEKEIYGRDKGGSKYLSGVVMTLDMDALERDGFSRLLKSIKNSTSGPVFEFYDQQSALVHLGKHHRLFADRQILEDPDGKPIKLYAAVSPDDWDEREENEV